MLEDPTKNHYGLELGKRAELLSGTVYASQPEADHTALRDRVGQYCRDDHLRDLDLVYQIAHEVHRGLYRRSGDPYITHSISVAALVAEWGLPLPFVSAALAHDLPDDESHWTRLRFEMDAEVVEIVDAVEALDGVTTTAAGLEQAMNDPRFSEGILIVKLPDRLHNVRTLRFCSPSTRIRAAEDALGIFAPLAATLGLSGVGQELQHLARAALNSEEVALLQYVDPDHAPLSAQSSRVFGLSDAILHKALRLLPASERQRYAEEWVAEMSSIESGRGHLVQRY